MYKSIGKLYTCMRGTLLLSSFTFIGIYFLPFMTANLVAGKTMNHMYVNESTNVIVSCLGSGNL